MLLELQTFFLSMVPLLELRASIPVALIVYQMSPLSAYFWAVMGNMIPIFLVIFFFDLVSSWISQKSLVMKRFFSFLLTKTRRDHGERVGKYGYLALALFIAIPLPVSGAWTGSLVAVVFGLSKKWSIISISLGVMLAGVGVLFITQAGIGVEEKYGLQALFGLLLFAGLLYVIIRKGFKR